MSYILRPGQKLADLSNASPVPSFYPHLTASFAARIVQKLSVQENLHQLSDLSTFGYDRGLSAFRVAWQLRVEAAGISYRTILSSSVTGTLQEPRSFLPSKAHWFSEAAGCPGSRELGHGWAEPDLGREGSAHQEMKCWVLLGKSL